MELILINQSKLKIMLDESDMKEYNIGNEADCANNETRHAIRSILDMAKSRIGFDTEGSEIFVQLYTSKGGGCELFVTKSELLKNAPPEQRSDKRTKKRDSTAKKPQDGQEDCRALTVKSESAIKSRRTDAGRMIFSFETLGDICTVCRILKKIGLNAESRAYTTVFGDYYLVLESTGMSAYTRLDRLTFILEYGKRERSDHISTYLSEHGRLICGQGAIGTLATF